MSLSLAISPYQSRPALKVLHFGINSKEFAQIASTKLNAELDLSEKKMGIKPESLRKQDNTKLSPEDTINVLAQRIRKFTDKSYDLAYKDALTGLYNRAAYNKDRSKLFINACQEQQPLSFLNFDLDKFKSYNDEFGHPEGDIALKEYGRIVKETVSEDGIAYRTGGEELVAILPNANTQKAAEISEKIRLNLEEQTQALYENGTLKRPLTVSIGHSTFEPKPEMQNIKEIIEISKDKSQIRKLFKPMEASEKLSDAALYLAKNQGRNRVCGANDFSK